VIVPDDQLSLAIGRDGQNARLAAKLTGWKVDIKSETEFSQVEEEIEIEGAEDADGRCSAVLSAGRRCPNAALPGSRYCGLPQHQALARFETNNVTVLAPLSEEEVAKLSDPDAGEGDLAPLIERAEAEFSEEAEAEAEEPAAEVAEEEEESAEEPEEGAGEGEPDEETEEAEEAEEPVAEVAEEDEEAEEPVEEAEEEDVEEAPAEPSQEAEVANESEGEAEAEAADEVAEAEEPEPATASERETE
jgi:N utilization substance protein A